MLTEGLSHTSSVIVSEETTAAKIGSGDMPVFATPAMMALMENAAMLAVSDELPDGSSTVGGQIESSHLRPSAIGAEIKATATLEKIDGRKLYFKVEAYDGDKLIGEGKHLRFIVDRQKFLSKLS